MPEAAPVAEIPDLPQATLGTDEQPLAVELANVTSEIPRTPGPASISEFALDLEDSLGEDFAIAPPLKPVPAAPVAIHAAAAVAAVQVPSIAASALEVGPAAEAVVEDQQANTVLADLFAEFKEDVEGDSSKQDEDPETHYNLGLAFKEMGLLDEAIGELQKVAQSVEHGAEFAQTMQAYTWLAQCFLIKVSPKLLSVGTIGR